MFERISIKKLVLYFILIVVGITLITMGTIGIFNYFSFWELLELTTREVREKYLLSQNILITSSILSILTGIFLSIRFGIKLICYSYNDYFIK